MNVIEPCCAERQIGKLLREHRGHAVLFQTNGDVTLEKWMKAVMLLSGDRPRTLTLAVPIFTQKMMDIVSKYMRLEWVSHLRLLTTDPLSIDAIRHFAALASHPIPEGSPATVPSASPEGSPAPVPSASPEGSPATVPEASASDTPFLSRLTLAADPAIPASLLMFSGPAATVFIQGPMPDTITPALHLYAGTLSDTNPLVFRAMTDAWEARFRARRYTPSLDEPVSLADAKEPVVDGSPVDTASAQIAGAVSSHGVLFPNSEQTDTSATKDKRVRRKKSTAEE